MRTKLFFPVLCFALLAFAGCEKENNPGPPESGPLVEWITGGTTTTYTYSGGVISGYNFHRSFEVSRESGEVTIEVEVLGDSDTKVSATFNVVKDQQYDLKVHANKDGSQVASPGTSCLTVVFSSPQSGSDQEISVGSYLVSAGGFDTYYCPESFLFEEIQMVE
jgi:hypothetical protein